MLELELTYLARSIPSDLLECNSKKIIDLYIESGGDHPNLRVRQNGKKFEITRKVPVIKGDASKQNETTIALTEEEFTSFLTSKNRKIEKIRYCYKYQDLYAEIDVFEGKLQGLVVVDFEFETEEDKNVFSMPDFCLADVTQELFIAGGMLAGKGYADIEEDLQRFGYKKLFLQY